MPHALNRVLQPSPAPGARRVPGSWTKIQDSGPRKGAFAKTNATCLDNASRRNTAAAPSNFSKDSEIRNGSTSNAARGPWSTALKSIGNLDGSQKEFSAGGPARRDGPTTAFSPYPPVFTTPLPAPMPHRHPSVPYVCPAKKQLRALGRHLHPAWVVERILILYFHLTARSPTGLPTALVAQIAVSWFR